jgi:hypothetical protein
MASGTTGRQRAFRATVLGVLVGLAAVPAASGNAGPIGLPPQPGHWRLTHSKAVRGIDKRFQAKSGSFVLRRSGNQRFVVSKLRMTLPGDLPHGSPCWQNSPLKVLGTFTATRSRNGEYVLWLIDAPARFVLNGEERTGKLEMAFQRGIPGGYYRGETHPVVLGVEVPYGNEGLACAYNSAGRPAGRSSTSAGQTHALAVLALPASAAAKPKPTVAWTPPRAVNAKAPIPFSWSARHLGRNYRLVIQRPVGTAHTWQTMMKLPTNSGSAQLPGVPLGRYRYRIAALRGHRLLAQQVAAIVVFGEVPFSVLLGERASEGVFNTTTTAFPYVADYGSRQGAVLSVRHNRCTFVHIGFLAAYPGLPSYYDKSTFSATLTVVQESRDPVSATVPYEGIGSVDAELVPGQTWGINVSSISDDFETFTYINGYAVCDSREAIG